MTRRVSRKCKGICSFVLVVLLVFYIEVLSYIVNTQDWTPFPTRSPQQKENGDDGPLRVLVVADPQIIGMCGRAVLMHYAAIKLLGRF